MTSPASQEIKRRLSIAARRLGTSDPGEPLGGLLDRTFSLPLGDPRYGRNTLIPGSMPLEHSFSETAMGSFRLDMEPLGPDATAGARRQEASREMRRIAQMQFGQAALRWFDQRSEPWRGEIGDGAARFGAWFGLGCDESGVREAKVYYELGPGQLDALPPNLAHAARVAMDALPGLLPLFVSIACGRHRGSQRLYLTHRGELRLLDLESMMNRLGIGHQLSGLLGTIGLILGGRFALPEGSVLIGLRDTGRGFELKLDILLPGVPEPPREMHGLIQMQLAQRPDSQRALRQWIQAMTPDAHGTPGDMSAISVRVTPATGSRLSVYFRPVGYALEAPRRAPRQLAVATEHMAMA